MVGQKTLRHNARMLLTTVDQWIQLSLTAWQSVAAFGLWQQNAFLLALCLVTCCLLFLTGTVMGLFMQSLWAILASYRHATEEENK